MEKQIEIKRSEGYKIDEEGRVVAPSAILEFEIVKHCNLNCAYCDHFSPWKKGFVSLADLTKWFETWSRKITIPQVHILGGEPLLHPDLIKILKKANEFWCNSQIFLVTNGYLVGPLKAELLPLLKDLNITLVISKHFNTRDYNKKLRHILDIVSSSGVSFKLRHSYRHWFQTYEISKDGIPYLNNKIISNPSKAYNNCISSKCYMIKGNHLYRCTNLCVGNELIKNKVISPDERFLSYKPLSPNSSKETIIKHLVDFPLEQCAYCPEKYTIIKPVELRKLLIDINNNAEKQNCSSRQVAASLITYI